MDKRHVTCDIAAGQYHSSHGFAAPFFTLDETLFGST